MLEQAVALIELTSIARGYRVADDVVKKAPVRLLEVGVVSPGKYLVVMVGDVGSVEESYVAGLGSGAEWVVDHLFLPQPHPEVVAALERALVPAAPDALGIVETFSAASTLRSADVALKAAQVQLLELHFARHLGGKGYWVVTGEQTDVEAALEASAASLKASGLLLKQELIARPHEDFKAVVAGPGASGLGSSGTSGR